MHQRRPLHQRVVDVEERGRGQIGRRCRRGRRASPSARCVDSGLGAGVAGQRLHGGFVTIADAARRQHVRHPNAGYLMREPAQVVLLTRQGCSLCERAAATARRAGRRARLRADDHRRRRRGRGGRSRAAGRVRRPAAGGAARRRASTATGSSTSPGCGPILAQVMARLSKFGSPAGERLPLSAW